MSATSPAAMYRPQWSISVSTLLSFACLYVVLVAYGFVYEYFVAEQLTTLVQTDFIAYDASRGSMYEFVAFFTPLTLLPIGVKLQTPSQYIVGTLVVFLFVPTPIVFIPEVSPAEFWDIYALMCAGFLALSTMSSMSFALNIKALRREKFQNLTYVSLGLYALGLAYCAFTNQLSVPTFDIAGEARSEVTVSGFQSYIIQSFAAAFGGFFIAMGIAQRKYYFIALSIFGYGICYATMSEKSFVFYPIWIAYVYVAQRLFFRASLVRYLLTLIFPFLVGMFFFWMGEINGEGTLLTTVFGLGNFRMYTIPAVAFNYYYNYFHMHPLTLWSHINVVANFVHYPYGKQLSLLMNDVFQYGNYNASFVETDGLAAGGPTSIPFVAGIFGLILICINSCLRGLGATTVALVTASPAIVFVDVGLGPALLTNGLVVLTLVLLFAPKDTSRNLFRPQQFGTYKMRVH